MYCLQISSRRSLMRSISWRRDPPPEPPRACMAIAAPVDSHGGGLFSGVSMRLSCIVACCAALSGGDLCLSVRLLRSGNGVGCRCCCSRPRCFRCCACPRFALDYRLVKLTRNPALMHFLCQRSLCSRCAGQLSPRTRTRHFDFVQGSSSLRSVSIPRRLQR